jgi:two-component system sensor histidine kinase FlrB
MAVSRPQRNDELEAAFGAFQRVSEDLSASYQALEARVAALTQELQQAQAANAREQDESGRLANRLSHLLDALPAGVVVLDALGRVHQHNPAAAELLGEPLRGCHWGEVIARAFAPRPDDGHEISLRDGRRVSVATRALDPEPGQLILLTDLTSTRGLQAQLARHERLAAMGEMVASLAHQLRTPLATALLYVAHLARPQLADAERARVAEKIHGRLRHLEHLVNDMLVFARGGVSVAESVALGALLDDVAQAIEPAMAEGGCEFRYSRLAGAARLLGNREALAGAIANLLTNAIQACGRGGVIVLAADAAADAVTVRVQDDGPGIAPALQARLFEPFFTTRAGGTGLGLAVVQAVAAAHGGRVFVESQAGQGATFGISLPLAGVAP